MQTPPWIAPADPLAATAKGLSLGLEMGSQQAAQRFQEQQMLAKDQEDAQKQAQWEAEYGLRAAEVARKHQAMQEYRSRIAAGEDPLKVIMEVGPASGMGGAAEAAAIRAANQRPPATWSMITGLPPGVTAMQSSRGGIHVVPTPRLSPQWEDVTIDGRPAQREKNTGKVQYAPNPKAAGMTDLQSMMMADRYAREMDKIKDANSMLDLSDEATLDPAWSKLKQNQWTTAKSRLKELQGKIDGLEGAGAANDGPSSHTEAGGQAPGEASTNPIKPGSIRLAGANVPRGTMPAPTAAPPRITAPADNAMRAGPWMMPMANPDLPAAPAPAPERLRGSFQPGHPQNNYDVANIDKGNQGWVRKLANDQLVDAAQSLGLENSTYRDGLFRVWRNNEGPDQQKALSRRQFEEAVLKLAGDKQMVWREE